MLDTTTYLPKLKEFEGVIRFMYLDNALPPGPFVTVGVGFLLANGAAAEKLAFVERANPAMKATADAIKADFENVKKQPGGKDASFYRQFTRLDLPNAAIDAELMSKVRDFQANLVTVFPAFDSYPSTACAAIFDIVFNVGVQGFRNQYVKFMAFGKKKDWANAANESHRNGIGDSRNHWTQAQLLLAAGH